MRYTSSKALVLASNVPAIWISALEPVSVAASGSSNSTGAVIYHHSFGDGGKLTLLTIPKHWERLIPFRRSDTACLCRKASVSVIAGPK
jgi:hypothetical protein